MSFTKLTPEIIRQHKGISFTGITTVFICHDGQGNILTSKRSKNARDEHGRWEFGAGGLKHGQSPEETVAREVKEEYDVDANEIDFLGYFDAIRDTPHGVPSHWVVFCFTVLVDRNKVKINEPELIDEHAWVTVDTIPHPQHSQMGIFLGKFGEKLKGRVEK